MTYRKIFLIFSSIILISACSSLKLTPAEFGWPIESVLTVDEKGFVKDDRHVANFNVKNLFYEEKEDSNNVSGKVIRLIRNNDGFYFITSNGFKNVYIFAAKKGALVLENKILVNENGLKNPAFNQRKPFIELMEETAVYKLTSDGIERGEK